MKKRIPGLIIILLALGILLLVITKTLYSWIGLNKQRSFSDSQPVSGAFHEAGQEEQSKTIGIKSICKDCNVILVTMTNLRYDHMSSNGYFRPTTPNLDEFSKESLVFDNAFAHSSWTLPEGISIYTGLYPYQHGVMNRYDGSKLVSGIPTLIDILNNNGYKTAAFTGGFDYNTKFGLTDRFGRYEECRQNAVSNQTGAQISGPSAYGELACTIPKAIIWLSENVKNKFFLHVQGFDAHCPFSQRGGYIFDKDYRGTIDYSSCLWTFDRSKPIIENGREYHPVYSSETGTEKNILLSKEDIGHLVSLYDESIYFADEQIGLLLKEIQEMGLMDKTIIIFTSEHGDMFGKHGRFMRGGPLRGTFYDDVLHVPLIIKHPKIKEKKIDDLAGHIDLMPTLLEFLGIKSQVIPAGKSLAPLVLQNVGQLGKNKEINSYVFGGSEFNPDSKNPYFFKKTRIDIIRNKQWKLIQETMFGSAVRDKASKTVELYDIVVDKEELYNLADTRKDTVKTLQSSLNMWLVAMKK